MDVINLKTRGTSIKNMFQYDVTAKMNGHAFTLVRGSNRTLDFHIHEDSDEVFIVVSGSMKLEFRDKVVDLKEWDMCVVPKGTEHRPVCNEEVTCLLIEKDGTLTPENTGGTYKG